jgi:hypothetical protein
MSGSPALVRAAGKQQRAAILAAALIVGLLWVTIPLGRWEVGVFAGAGIALGLVNQILTERSLLRCVESGDLLSRKQFAMSSLVRLLGISLAAGILVVIFWPNGATVLLGLALFHLLVLVLTGFPLIKELRKA